MSMFISIALKRIICVKLCYKYIRLLSILPKNPQKRYNLKSFCSKPIVPDPIS